MFQTPSRYLRFHPKARLEFFQFRYDGLNAGMSGKFQLLKLLDPAEDPEYPLNRIFRESAVS